MLINEMEIITKLLEAQTKALKSLAGYKFLMFGYHAAQFVMLNQLFPKNKRSPNPFKPFVQLAREMLKDIK